jgi:hypothetical protein
LKLDHAAQLLRVKPRQRGHAGLPLDPGVERAVALGGAVAWRQAQGAGLGQAVPQQPHQALLPRGAGHGPRAAGRLLQLAQVQQHAPARGPVQLGGAARACDGLQQVAVLVILQAELGLEQVDARQVPLAAVGVVGHGAVGVHVCFFFAARSNRSISATINAAAFTRSRR